MKTKIFGGIAVLAIALAIAFNVSLNLNKSNNQLSQLALANVEALASVEEGLNPGWWLCPGTGWICPKNYYGQTEYDLCLLIF